MKKTSHTSKNHKRRKPILGLTPDDVVKKMQEEASAIKPKVRKLFPSSERSRREVLSDAREGGTDPAGKAGIFGTAPRAGDSKPPVPDAARGSESNGTQLSRVLKKMLGESPPPDLMAQEGIVNVATNAEMLGAIVMREALNGKQWAVEMVRDQSEGKPIRAAQVNNSESEIEDQLDRVSMAALNQLAKGK